jgi:transcriptional regulator with XRE-family HTH domain
VNFAKYRKRAKLTQAEVARAIGVSDAAVCQWEKGETMPNAARLTQIAKLYKCKVDDLLKKE